MSASADDILLLDGKVRSISEAFDRAGIPHAFGGAIALAYWATPRGTEDVDVNVFVGFDQVDRLERLLRQLDVGEPSESQRDAGSRQLLMLWGHTPVRLFFAYDAFHLKCAERRRRVPFAGGEIPVLSPEDIAVFKIIYDRPRDRAEVRELLLCMGERFDLGYALEWLGRILGDADARVVGFRDAVAEIVGPLPPRV